MLNHIHTRSEIESAHVPVVIDTIQSITEDPAVIKTVTCVVSQSLISAYELFPGADGETSLQFTIVQTMALTHSHWSSYLFEQAWSCAVSLQALIFSVISTLVLISFQ